MKTIRERLAAIVGEEFGPKKLQEIAAFYETLVPKKTVERPTTPGWYWYRPQSERYSEDLFIIVEVGDGTVTFPNGWNRLMSLVCEGEWAGPLEPPR